MLCPRLGAWERPLVHSGLRFLPREHQLQLKSTLLWSNWSHISPAWKYLQFLKTMFQFKTSGGILKCNKKPTFLFLPPTPGVLETAAGTHGLSIKGRLLALYVVHLCFAEVKGCDKPTDAGDSGWIMGRKWASRSWMTLRCAFVSTWHVQGLS